MRQIGLLSFLKCPVAKLEHPMLVNIRGCNGAGKSTIPLSMLQTDVDAFEVTWNYDGSERVVATVFPKYQFLALGKYRTKCGGLDTLKTTQEVKDAVDVLWDCNFHILMEGVLASTVRGTYVSLFQKMVQQHPVQRYVTIYNIIPPLKVCLQRVLQRNGGKPVKSKLLDNKWSTVQRNHRHFLEAGLHSIVVDNTEVKLEDTLDWFFGQVFSTVEVPQPSALHKVTKPLVDEKLTKFQKVKALSKFDGTPEELYLPTLDDVDGYEWTPYYKAPNPAQVKVNWVNMKLFWYWMAERMNIWYRRTVLREPQPWTDDAILQENKFTNVFRDLDRGTIVYIKEILNKMDELPSGVDDAALYQRIQEVILNTQIYRLFLKYGTWKQIEFLYLDTYKEQWEQAKDNLRRMKANGEIIWHGAYFVNHLKSANLDSATNSDKLENALCLCEQFYEHLEDTTNYVMNHNMRDCLDYLDYFPGAKNFNVYEWLCDWGMAYRHIRNYFVPWTDDSYVSVGVGNKRGLDFIFEDKGNLDYYELNFYLRASWKHYMKRYGYYDRFISQLPKWTSQDINMRVIEHDICEFQKYLVVYYGIGRCKGRFKNESANNLDYLLI